MKIKSLMSFEGLLSYMVTSVLVFIVLVPVDSGLCTSSYSDTVISYFACYIFHSYKNVYLYYSSVWDV